MKPAAVASLREALEGVADSLAGRAHVVVYGAADEGRLASSLLARGAVERVTVAVGDAAAVARVRERLAGLARAHAVVVDSLAELESAPVDAVVVVPRGYEGHDRLRGTVEEAAVRLDEGGELVVVAHARSGAAAFERFLRDVLGGVEVSRAGGGMRVLRARRAGAPVLAGTTGASDLVTTTVRGRTFEFATEQGIFSRGRLDAGTRLLLETVEVGGAQDVLDLGCGYGAIGVVVAATSPQTRVVLLDVDARAVALARRNADANGVADRTETVVADGVPPNGRAFDLILSHFPLHVRRDVRARLVREASDALRPGGRLCTVALAQYDLRPHLEVVFPHVRELATSSAAGSASKPYVVLEARR